MILATHGIVGSQITQFVGLLDTYSGAAAAYSLRLLRTAYTGSAIRVRRANDNTEENIGFDSNGNLDTAFLTSFCSGTNGFVKTWYDQSGNARDATQTTAENQPQIVSSGSVILDNGKPSVLFDGSNDNLIYSGSSISAQNNLSLISVSGAITAGTSTQFILTAGLPTANNAAGIAYTPDEKINMFAWASLDTISAASYLNQTLSFGTIQGTNTSLSINSTNTTTNTLSTSISIQNSTIHIGTRPVTVQLYLKGKAQELITYYSNQSTNRTGIESNINTYYGIY